LYEWNDLETALARLMRGLDLIPLWWGKADDMALAYTTLSRILIAQGNQVAAGETVEKAIQLIHASGVFSEARNAVETIQVKTWLAQGNWQAAARWASSIEKGIISGDPFRFENELAQITLSRVYIAQKKLEEAIRLLSRLEESAQSGGRTGRLIEILILKALALRRLGETAQALGTLEESLSLAEPEGYIRIFVDEGSPMEELLRIYSKRRGDSLKAYTDMLSDAFIIPARLQGDSAPPSIKSGILVEPLTGREAEVLQLLADGLSNHEIAERLVLSEGTVKTHAHNLYGKLGAQSRTLAIARAKELKLI
jgi:LuxR family maltose regulon positive regulatory protein